MNGYIVDAFLSFWLWFWLSWLISALPCQIEQINKRMDRAGLAAALERLAKPTLCLVAPLLTAYGFLLWRFCHLLWQGGMWGAGAIGLTLLMAAIGICLITFWLLAFLLLHSPWSRGAV